MQDTAQWWFGHDQTLPRDKASRTAVAQPNRGALHVRQPVVAGLKAVALAQAGPRKVGQSPHALLGEGVAAGERDSPKQGRQRESKGARHGFSI